MGKYILKRILIAIPVLIGITLIDYAIMCLAGSPLEMLKGPGSLMRLCRQRRLRQALISRLSYSISCGFGSSCREIWDTQ